MPRKPISFELDFMIKDIFPRFTVKQFDDVSFNIKPLNQGLEYDTTGMTGKIFVGVNNDMFMQTTGITVSSDNINVLLDKNMLQKNGRAYAEIELTDEAGTITSSSFIFDIDAKIGEGGMIPGEYEGFVEKYERLISEFKAQINSSISNSNDLVDKTIKNCNTSVDSKLNTVDDRLNTKIREVNEKLDTVDTRFNSKISDFEKRFNRLTASQQQDAEVIEAREEEVSLKARLDRDIENPKKLYTAIEGTEISTNSLEGYLKDVEILGNTVQDTDNLADIRSVGDKLENQELYEIPALIRGKNLFNGNIIRYGYYDKTGAIISNSSYGISEYIKLKVNSSYNLSSGQYIAFFDKDKKFIRRFWGTSIIPTNNEVYIVICPLLTEVDSLQLEEGTVATPYEPCQEHKLTILSPTPLEKVGDVADRIICKDGIWGVEKNVQTIVVDGTNAGIVQSNTGGLSYPIRIDLETKTLVGICDRFNTRHTNDTEGFYLDGTYLRFAIMKDSLPTTESSLIDNAKLYLSKNPFIFKYVVKEPTFIPLSNSQQVKLRTFANKTNIHFGCEIEPTIKASVPKSIGATVNTHTEQIDNLGKELEKINNSEESIVSTVTTESDFTTVENTNNGYFDDVKLEGKTLVNLASCRNRVQNMFYMQGNGPYKFEYKNLTEVKCYISTETTQSLTYQLNNICDVGKTYTIAFTFNNKTCADLGIFYSSTGYNANNGKQIAQVKANSSLFIKFTFDAVEGFKLAHALVQVTSETEYVEIKDLILLEGDHTQNPPEFFEGIKSVGQDVDEISVLSTNKEETKEDKKRILYYNEETQTWEKPILRQWDSIEKHSDNKYYYHVRSEEVPYTEGDETKADHITDMTTTVKKLSTEKVYECTNLDLITYSGETNLVTRSGVLNPKVTLKVKKGIGNVVTMLQNKVAILEKLVNKLIQK